jgi:hypothetical protein
MFSGTSSLNVIVDFRAFQILATNCRRGMLCDLLCWQIVFPNHGPDHDEVRLEHSGGFFHGYPRSSFAPVEYSNAIIIA